MKQLTEEQRDLVMTYERAVPLAFRKLYKNETILRYKEDLYQEGFKALCIASRTIDIENYGEEEIFMYFFRAALNTMQNYINRFIYPENNIISLDEPVEMKDGTLNLYEILEDTHGYDNNYVQNIIEVYNNWCSKFKRKNYKSDRLADIITWMSEGFTQTECARILGVSKQVINNQIHELALALRWAHYV